MKNYLLIILFLFSISNLYPQDKARLEIELFIVVEGLNEGQGIFFTFNSVQDFVYENDANRYIFNTTSNYLNCSLPVGAPGVYGNNLIFENSTYPNNMRWLGFDFVSGSEQSAPPEIDDFGYGLYKLIPWTIQNDIVVELPGAFYLDMRDSHYPKIFGYPYYGNADFFFLYNLSIGQFKSAGFFEPSSSSGFDEPINANSLVTIWGLNNSVTPHNSLFPSTFWNNNLILIPSETGNKPRLVWSQHPTITVNNFIVYRTQSSVPLSHPEIYSTPIATLGANVFEFVDNDVRLSGSTYFYYFIKGKYGTQYTTRTNIVSAQGGLFKENVTEELIHPVKFEVMNFPNPFNPSTTINYAIPENGFTELKVYNIYGELVEMLVSGNKEAGNYSARFPANGSGLSSGIYLYTLTSGKYKTTGKMTLVK